MGGMPETSSVTENPVERFVQLVGGPSQAAQLLGVSMTTITNLRNAARVTNALIALRMEDLSDEAGAKITVRELAGHRERWTGPTLRSVTPTGRGRGIVPPSTATCTRGQQFANPAASLKRAA